MSLFTLKNVEALQLTTSKTSVTGVCITPINGGMSVGGDVDITGGLSVSTTTITGGTITDSTGTINFTGTSIQLNTNDITLTNGSITASNGSITAGSTIIDDASINTASGILSITGSSGVSLYGGVSINGLVFPSSDGTANQVIQTNGAGVLSFVNQTGGGGGGGSGVTTLGGLSDAYVVDSEYNAILGTSPAGITGINNTGVGVSTLFSITSGLNNTAMGAEAGTSLTTGNYNTAVGRHALNSEVVGSDSTAIGYLALYLQSNLSTLDAFNTAVGSQAGNQLTTGTSCTFIGASSGGGNITGSNLTCLGFGSHPSASNATNEVTLGNNNITSLRCADTTIASLSDARDKNDIRDSTYGLNFLENVRPVEFTWDRRVLTSDDENDPKQGKRRVGFVAQELLEASGEDGNQILDLVYTANPQRLEAKYGNLIPVMVKAIQDLKAEVDTIKEHLNLE